jgi:PAS domain-containing protein
VRLKPKALEGFMPQQAIEVILMRQLASYLAMPIFLVDPAGNLLFYNEPAEALLGHRYEETGGVPFAEWARIFQPTSEDGSPLPSEALPLVIALQQHRATHLAFQIRGLDGVVRKIEATAFPLEGQGGRHLGAVAIFWEVGNP